MNLANCHPIGKRLGRIVLLFIFSMNILSGCSIRGFHMDQLDIDPTNSPVAKKIPSAL